MLINRPTNVLVTRWPLATQCYITYICPCVCFSVNCPFHKYSTCATNFLQSVCILTYTFIHAQHTFYSWRCVWQGVCECETGCVWSCVCKTNPQSVRLCSCSRQTTSSIHAKIQDLISPDQEIVRVCVCVCAGFIVLNLSVFERERKCRLNGGQN